MLVEAEAGAEAYRDASHRRGFGGLPWTDVRSVLTRVAVGAGRHLVAVETYAASSTPRTAATPVVLKAGCACGCSPGYVVKSEGARGRGDVFVDVLVAASEREREEVVA